MPNEKWITDAQRAVGDRIRVRRLHLDMTQEHLAELTGIDRSTIQRIEYGANDARVSHLLRIAKVLRVHAKDLLG